MSRAAPDAHSQIEVRRTAITDERETHVCRDVLLIAGLAAILFFPSFATRDLRNPDEPRYMEVAREMVAVYRMAVDRWTAGRALAEMRAYGFEPEEQPEMTSFVKRFPIGGGGSH